MKPLNMVKFDLKNYNSNCYFPVNHYRLSLKSEIEAITNDGINKLEDLEVLSVICYHLRQKGKQRIFY